MQLQVENVAVVICSLENSSVTAVLLNYLDVWSEGIPSDTHTHTHSHVRFVGNWRNVWHIQSTPTYMHTQGAGR